MHIYTPLMQFHITEERSIDKVNSNGKLMIYKLINYYIIIQESDI